MLFAEFTSVNDKESWIAIQNPQKRIRIVAKIWTLPPWTMPKPSTIFNQNPLRILSTPSEKSQQTQKNNLRHCCFKNN